MAGTLKNNSFSIQFEEVVAEVSKKDGVLVVDNMHRSDFFNLVVRFGLNVMTSDGKMFVVMPAPNESHESLAMHISTWDIVYHKFFSYSNDFWRANAEHHRKLAVRGKTIPFPMGTRHEALMG